MQRLIRLSCQRQHTRASKRTRPMLKLLKHAESHSLVLSRLLHCFDRCHILAACFTHLCSQYWNTKIHMRRIRRVSKKGNLEGKVPTRPPEKFPGYAYGLFTTLEYIVQCLHHRSFCSHESFNAISRVLAWNNHSSTCMPLLPCLVAQLPTFKP
jgi:hypothetical protein